MFELRGSMRPSRITSIFCVLQTILLAETVPIDQGAEIAASNRFYLQESCSDSEGPLFKGLVLMCDSKGPYFSGEELNGEVRTIGLQIPGSERELELSIFPRFYNRSLNKETILQIKQAVIDYYFCQGYPVVKVIVPKQEVSDGILKLVVIVGRLDQVVVTGNRWFSAERYCKAIRLYQCEEIRSNKLITDLYWLNRNPFRHVDLAFVPGSQEGTTSVDLLVDDRFPLRLYGGIDNTGNDLTGNNRIMTGFNWGDAFFLDQILSYQFTFSPEMGRFKSHTVHYAVPLPWRHTFTAYGGYSSVSTNFFMPPEVPKFGSSGWSAQASGRYDIPLRPNDSILHDFTFGFDWKRTNNNLLFSEIPIVSKNVNLSQFMASYTFGYENPNLRIGLEVEGFWSPGQMMADEKESDYTSLRAHADPKYFYVRGSTFLDWQYWRTGSMEFFVRAQGANENLLPSEEFGIGGYDTVRGYKERTFNGDNAFVGNFEFKLPSFKILSYISPCRFSDSCQFLGFFDFGWASQHKTSLPPKSATLYSVGPGVRYNFPPYITVRADWGFQLHSFPGEGIHQRLHFSAILGY